MSFYKKERDFHLLVILFDLRDYQQSKSLSCIIKTNVFLKYNIIYFIIFILKNTHSKDIFLKKSVINIQPKQHEFISTAAEWLRKNVWKTK